MKLLTTPELEGYVRTLYGKLKPLAETDGIYRPLEAFLLQVLPKISQVVFVMLMTMGIIMVALVIAVK